MSDITKIIKLIKEVLARDAEFGLSGMPNDCGCIRLSRDAEREYEMGVCPHQRAREMLRGMETCMCGEAMEGHNVTSGHTPLSMWDYYQWNGAWDGEPIPEDGKF